MFSRFLQIYLVLAPSMALGYSSYSTSQAITSDHGSRKMDVPARKLEVFGGGPGSGHVTVLAVNLGQADDVCVILEQPHSVNTTVGSTATFFVVTSSQCKFAYVTIWQPDGEEMEESVDISGSLSTHQNITYEIREVSLNESRLHVMFTVLPLEGYSVNSSTALMLVQGIPEQVSNIKVIWKSLTSVRITCEAPPILDNVDQWGTVYTSLAPPTSANMCNFTLSVVRSSQRDLFTAQTVSISWSTAAGDGENASVFAYFPGEFTISSVELFPVSCSAREVCLFIRVRLVEPVCRGCYPTEVHLYVKRRNGKTVPLGPSYKIPVNMQASEFEIREDALFKFPKHRRHNVLAEFCNLATNVTRTVSVNAFDVQKVFTERLDNGSICFSCSFLANSLVQRCIGRITEPNSNRTVTITAARSHHSEARTENVCTEVRLKQNSSLEVFDVYLNGSITDDPAYSEILPNGESTVLFSINIGATIGAVVFGVLILVGAVSLIVVAPVVIHKHWNKRTVSNTGTDHMDVTQLEQGAHNNPIIPISPTSTAPLMVHSLTESNSTTVSEIEPGGYTHNIATGVTVPPATPPNNAKNLLVTPHSGTSTSDDGFMIDPKMETSRPMDVL